MSKNIKQILTGLMVIPLMAVGIVNMGITDVVMAANADITNGMNTTGAQASNPTDLPSVFKIVTDILLFLIGAVSVIMLIYGGIRYTTSGGNATSMAGAKNTIIYAIAGLIISILAYAIVSFIATQLRK